MKYAIRPLEEGDINDIVSGETRIFGYSLGYDMIYAELKINPYAHYFVLEIDGGFGGYIGLWIYEENTEIINFFVAEEYQGLGFGKLLWNLLLNFESVNVKQLGVEKTIKSINLYEKLDLPTRTKGKIL